MNILDGAEVDINWKHLQHVQQRVQFSPIISQCEFQKFKLNYLENVLLNSVKILQQQRHVITYHW